MELFLLLSMGLSIVAFISIALNQAPSPHSVSEHSPESTFPREHYMMIPESINLLKLEDQIISQEFEIEGKQRASTSVTEEIPAGGEQILVALEV